MAGTSVLDFGEVWIQPQLATANLVGRYERTGTGDTISIIPPATQPTLSVENTKLSWSNGSSLDASELRVDRLTGTWRKEKGSESLDLVGSSDASIVLG